MPSKRSASLPSGFQFGVLPNGRTFGVVLHCRGPDVYLAFGLRRGLLSSGFSRNIQGHATTLFSGFLIRLLCADPPEWICFFQ